MSSNHYYASALPGSNPKTKFPPLTWIFPETCNISYVNCHAVASASDASDLRRWGGEAGDVRCVVEPSP